ncbi:MAG: flavodoxin family protein [Candidatus Heimdallarchaeota archaeon]|nr:MAG: flavodoxin family protein [Candidatus Heimdallarchaeota archaeon]
MLTKVLIVNGSPRIEKSNTTFVITPFMEGMKKAGASVEMIYTKKLKILPCIGCFKCWGETIGECFIQDDMQELYPKLKEVDILIIATPVYSPLPGEIQNLLNRLVPLIEPLLEFRQGRTRAKCHDDVNISKMLAVVVGGWWEIENLDLVVKIVEEVSETYTIEFSGAILRPHAYFLRDESETSKLILKKLEDVGFKLIKEGILDKTDLAFVSQPLVKKEEYIERGNRNYLKRKSEQN